MIAKNTFQFSLLSFASLVILFLVCLPAHAAETVPYPNACDPSTTYKSSNFYDHFVGVAKLGTEEKSKHYAELLGYLCSGQYDRDIEVAINEASEYIGERIMSASPGEKLAIVLDIDETSLSNIDQIREGDFLLPSSGPYEPCGKLSKKRPDPSEQGCGYTTWQGWGLDPAIGPMLELYRNAKEHGVTVFFVTGRFDELVTPDGGNTSDSNDKVAMREVTKENLVSAGYSGVQKQPDQGGDCLFLIPTISEKTPESCGLVHITLAKEDTATYKRAVRDAIRNAGYSIIANIGDQTSDLIGPGQSSEPSEASFLLPNPFY